MTTPNTDLQEQIAQAVADAQNVPFVGPKQRKIAAAVMPRVEAAVKRGKAEVLRDAARHIEHVVRVNPERAFTEHVLHDNGGPGYLRELADEIEEETPDEH